MWGGSLPGATSVGMGAIIQGVNEKRKMSVSSSSVHSKMINDNSNSNNDNSNNKNDYKDTDDISSNNKFSTPPSTPPAAKGRIRQPPILSFQHSEIGTEFAVRIATVILLVTLTLILTVSIGLNLTSIILFSIL
jgi:hypothetical protein